MKTPMGKVLVDYDADLTRDLEGEDNLNIRELKTLIIASTIKTLRKQLRIDDSRRKVWLQAFGHHFVIAEMKNGVPEFLAFDLTAEDVSNPRPIVTEEVSSLSTGWIFDWSWATQHIDPIPATQNAMDLLRWRLDHVYQVESRKHPDNPAYDPPYSIVTLTSDGVRAAPDMDMPPICHIN